MVSPVDGVVTLSRWDEVFGNWVHVTENGTGAELWLCHLASRAVSVGQHVRAGDYIGPMGETGKANGRHLHFEYHPGGQDRGVDPREFYRSGAAAGGSASTESEEDDMPIMIKANVNIYVLSPGQIKLCDSTRQVTAAKAAGVKQHDLSGTTAQQNQAFVDLLDVFGIPQNIFNANGWVLNPESGKHEKNGLWNWERASLTKRS